MFHSAAVRLTIWYTAIIMALSISTSFALYQVSNDYLEQNTDRQAGYFGGLLGPQSADEFASLRQKLLDENRDQLKGKLVIFNVLVLIGGGVASYGLARRTLRPIEETLESQVRFTADASHELRTPLTAIQTENEVALRNSKLSKDEAVAILKSNLEEAAKLKALSEGLLSLAHSNGDDELAEKVSAKDIVASAKERVSKAAKLKEISISPVQKTADVTLKGNQQKLVDLLVILLDNAVKYSPAG
ncbi:HAMP domain-containing histidine kinase, partial [Candidatus Saccharibacteria bacterium]|nr:HAMP domain-containing histidine kinase [Candidatus Saccharibacteria bacterium]